MTPQQIIEQLDELCVGKTGATTWAFDNTTIKAFFISTIISVLKEEEGVIEGMKFNHMNKISSEVLAIEGKQIEAHNLALSNYQLAIQKKIKEWELLARKI